MADRKHKTGFDRQRNKNNKKSKHPTPVQALEGRYEWSSGCVSRRYQNGELEEMRKLATGSTREGHLAPAFPSLQMSVKSIRENDSRLSLTWYVRLNPVVKQGRSTIQTDPRDLRVVSYY